MLHEGDRDRIEDLVNGHSLSEVLTCLRELCLAKMRAHADKGRHLEVEAWRAAAASVGDAAQVAYSEVG